LQLTESDVPSEIIAALTFLACAVAAMLLSQWRRKRDTTLEQRVLKHGTVTMGKIIAINRPIGSRNETEVYFSFDLPGSGSFLRSCCIDLRALKEQSVLFPSVGAQVSVRYLPEDPQCAVIPQLAPCLSGTAASAD
jgi:hypothetical protein